MLYSPKLGENHCVCNALDTQDNNINPQVKIDFLSPTRLNIAILCARTCNSTSKHVKAKINGRCHSAKEANIIKSFHDNYREEL